MRIQTLKISAEQREKAILAAGFAGHDEAVCELKFGGQPIGKDLRDELLAKCKNGEYVEIELNVIAYEQFAGKPNRNFVRVADEAMSQLAKTSKGKPFLRDHQQRDTMAVCGTIFDAYLEKIGDDGFRVMQKVKLTAPWAVDLALRGLLNTVSISWRATDKVMCSACKTQVFTDCYHWPGDRVKQMVIEGKVYYVRNRKEGDIVVEWVYNGVEALETSPVPVPAVPTARIDGIRASLSADLADDEILSQDPDNTPPENKNMNELEILKAQLARLTQISELNDGQKAYFRRLSVPEQDAFLAKSAADRNELCKTIYTAKNGQSFTATDDPRMVQMAKDFDAQQEKFDTALAQEKAKNLLSRANAELAHLSGTVEERAALLGAIDSITDADKRAAVLKMVQEFDVKASANFQRAGSGKRTKPNIANNPEEKLNDLAQKMYESDDNELTYEQCYAKVLESDEGMKLYAQMPTADQNQN